MKTLLAITAAVAALSAGRVSAADVTDPRYFTIDPNSIVIEEITDRGGTLPGATALPGIGQNISGAPAPSAPQINPPLNPHPAQLPTAPAVDPQQQFNNIINDVNSTVGTIGNIVNLAQKIWSIIQENQPVVNITTNYANAVPYGTSNWTQLENWSKPATKKYSFSMKNAFGSEVVKIAYQVDYTYGGDYNGKGKFLTGVTIEPLSVTTAWGYKVNLTSEVPDSTVANVGTQSDPVASMQVQLDWTVHTALKDTTSKAIYYVQGDGLLQEMGTPFKNAAALKDTKRSEAAAAQISGAQFN